MRNRTLGSSFVTLSLLLAAASAGAAPKLRVQVDQKGDFLLVGNTLGHDCRAVVPAPVVGSVGSCGTNTGDSAPDIYWRADGPAVGQAMANNAVTLAESRSTAVLNLKAGATVTHAFLYWGARRTGTTADTSVTVERQGGFTQAVTATESYTVNAGGGETYYQSVADVTQLVKTNGSGGYRVSGVDGLNFVNQNENVNFAGWYLVVLYQDASEPPRNLAVFDGLDLVTGAQSQSASLSGFLVPAAGFDAKLGVITFEGDPDATGDSLLFGKAPLTAANRLSDAVNPITNFFNSSRSFLGAPVSVAGDLPQLTGGQGSMSSFDLDVVDITSRVTAGQTSADIQATSSGDVYLLGGFVTSISTFKPDFSSSNKTATDLNGGPVLPGDVFEYTVVVTNNGNDTSVGTVLTDKLPAGVTYVPGSIQVSAGVGAGAKTDAAGDDTADFNASTNTVTVRLGTGANATTGGTMAVGESITVKLKVTIDATATGTIANQAIVTAGGQKGSPPGPTPTDGNNSTPGPQTTDIPIGATDADGDGKSDFEETLVGTDPNDKDSDDDGVEDGAEPDWDKDTDGDGLINALDPDSDDDGLYDGTELGLGCAGTGTDAAKGHCIADADSGATKTDPLKKDTDGGGASDGSEDANLNGALDGGETNPIAGNGSDDTGVVDTDKDGLSDALEKFLGSDPNDADSDDDGLLDGEERNPADDTDGDGLRNVLDVDSDQDGLYDGTESGKPCDDPPTSAAAGHCIADADATTTTSPVIADTDGGGVIDGSEDTNRNGKLDTGETDPTVGKGADDGTVVDTDKDGLADELEKLLGSDPNDADSDDDGVPDGLEPNFADDSDGDGKKNLLDADSDNDGLFDGTEMGFDCSNPATNPAANACKADADAGATKTHPLIKDTDGGGVGDGDEDSNKNGMVDAGERDPLNPADDNTGTGGTGGQAGSGGGGGQAGAGGQAGSGATGGAAGSGTGGTGTGGTGTGGTGTGASAGNLGASGTLEGGGCACSVPGPNGNTRTALALAGLAFAALVRRRRR
jgi:uncharacterized repeat protein (TIGR01451 family)/MYXO-CTERM domain-containing protein